MRRGFTLIELLVVIAIIGIMTGGALLTLGSGRDVARLKDASRGVAQMTHYANALALLRQRPVVVTYATETGEDGAPFARIDVRLSGEAMAATAAATPAEPIYREVDGRDTASAGVAAAEAEAAENEDVGVSVAEKAGMFFTRQILNPEELAKEDAVRSFEGLAFEVEMLGEDGAAVDERTSRQAQSRAQGILNNRTTAIKAWSSTQGEIDTEKVGREEEEEKTTKAAEREPQHVVFETNGTCTPHRITLRTAAEAEKVGSEGLVITVSRSGKTTIGNGEEKD